MERQRFSLALHSGKPLSSFSFGLARIRRDGIRLDTFRRVGIFFFGEWMGAVFDDVTLEIERVVFKYPSSVCC